ncbi:hypothetical protein DACRYDRAFT_95178 [Dacryopinax primogenitus]|uniref:Hydrophobin n=1 Tax=Dacryopinax primogenitus (strain DJM 731) TaxID=1858805 RepID=M5G0L8_DACPD|nr:uncharacterized protein DACRYDRAFT_95178 [Dacryopinax primogenitus]EJU01670.1 hypothetical protein DACRYDRAFT_95178 [Dacryopinax primogenitus]
MHSFTVFSALILAASALALPAVPLARAPEASMPVRSLQERQDNTIGDCNTTGQYCCDQTLSQSSASANAITSLLSLPRSVTPDPDRSLGFCCSPLASILHSGRQCTTKQVCCKGSQQIQSTLLGINCSPLSL